MIRIIILFLLMAITSINALATPAVECVGLFEPSYDIQNPEAFVKSIANKFRDRLESQGAVDMEDLIQGGKLALIELQQKFDPKKNISFRNLAWKSIYYSMIQQLSPHRNVRGVWEAYQEITLKQNEFIKKYGRAPEQEELAQEMGLSLEQYHEKVARVSEVLSNFRRDSLDEQIAVGFGENEGDVQSLYELIPDTSRLTPDLELSDKRGEKLRVIKNKNEALVDGIISPKLKQEIASTLYRLHKTEAQLFLAIDVQAMPWQKAAEIYGFQQTYTHEALKAAEEKIRELIDPTVREEFDRYLRSQAGKRDPRHNRESEKNLQTFTAEVEKLVNRKQISAELGQVLTAIGPTLSDRHLILLNGFYLDFLPTAKLVKMAEYPRESDMRDDKGRLLLRIQNSMNAKLWAEFEQFTKNRSRDRNFDLKIGHQSHIPERKMVIENIDGLKLNNSTNNAIKKSLNYLSDTDIKTFYYGFVQGLSTPDLKERLGNREMSTEELKSKTRGLRSRFKKYMQPEFPQEYADLKKFLDSRSQARLAETNGYHATTQNIYRESLIAEVLVSSKLSSATKEFLTNFLRDNLADIKVFIVLKAVFRKENNNLVIAHELIGSGIENLPARFKADGGTYVRLEKSRILREIREFLESKSSKAKDEFLGLIKED